MSFTITRIHIKDFRNYTEYDLVPDPSLTVIVGPNAVGKTNLVEAIQLVTEADSFRRPSWGDTIRWGQDEATVRLEASCGDRYRSVDLTITRPGRRSYRVNEKSKRSAGDIAGVIPCVLFTPEDLRIVKDAAGRRRELLDSLGSQLSKAYARLCKEYARVVRQRNALLRAERADRRAFEPLDSLLVSLGSRLMAHRVSLFDRLSETAVDMYREVSGGENLSMRYITSWQRDHRPAQDDLTAAETQAVLKKHLERVREAEYARGSTLIGPHRDDVEFFVESREARAYASQGQQRTVALALKLAEVRVVEDVAGIRPVLLLDDVMSELDSLRRDSLTEIVGRSAQTVVTTTNLGYFAPDLEDRALVVRLA